MKFVDAHIHLADNRYATKIPDLIEHAKKLNIIAIVSNSTDLESCFRNLKLVEKYSNHVYAALGIHPWNTKNMKPKEEQEIFDLILENSNNSQKVVAIGEIGLDSKYSGTGEPTEIQKQVFKKMLSAAEKTSLPVIIHSRGTTPQIIDLLPSFEIKKILLHWFSQPHSLIPTIIDRDYYITEGPPSVYSNGIRDVVRRTPLTNLLTETDGPVRFYKSPFKGKRTTPALIPTVVKAIAEVKSMDVADVAAQIIKNFKNSSE